MTVNADALLKVTLVIAALWFAVVGMRCLVHGQCGDAGCSTSSKWEFC
jgi:hypothetical protein